MSGDGMAMDAKEFFARQEQTARDIRQQLEKEHAERQKSAPSSTAQRFRVGDPVWVISPRPIESAALGRCGCRRARGRQDQWGRHARSLPGCCYWV